MSDLLNQSELDALLTETSTSTGKLDDRAAAIDKARPVVVTRDRIRDYDFRRPERLTSEQRRSLETIHESFSRNFAATLSGFIRTLAEVRLAVVEELTYSEFIEAQPRPACLNILMAPPLQGEIVLEISPLIVFPIVERLLGGAGRDVFVPRRPLTEIERRLIRRIIDRALDHLCEIWSKVAPAKFKLGETESNPNMVQIVPPNEIVVIIGFEIKIGGHSGTMTLCIPFNVIEPHMEKLVARSWLGYASKASGEENQSPKLSHNIQQADVLLKAFLAETTITMNDLLNLREGDILQTPRRADSELPIYVEDSLKFAATVGKCRGQKAIRITRPLRPTDRI
jgi:flagellar motor switch protein FliM